MGHDAFLHDGSDLVAEYDAAGTLLRRYVHGDSPGDDPLVWFEGAGVADSARRYLFADERGSIVATTDANGTPITINTYDEYGRTENMTAAALPFKSRFRYTGQLLIPELGLYYYKARMYAPHLGRFMQTDPIGYDDGMNMYAYVGGDPVNSVDPTGMNYEFLVSGKKSPKATFSTHGPVRIAAINAGTGLAPGSDGGPEVPQSITCDTKLPDGKTIGTHVRAAKAALDAAKGGRGHGIRGFVSAVYPYGPIDFKNTMKGQAPATLLAAAGNFAYGALANQFFGADAVAKQIMFAGAAGYARMEGKNDVKPSGSLFYTDRSAAAFAGPGFDAGCRK